MTTHRFCKKVHLCLLWICGIWVVDLITVLPDIVEVVYPGYKYLRGWLAGRCGDCCGTLVGFEAAQHLLGTVAIVSPGLLWSWFSCLVEVACASLGEDTLSAWRRRVELCETLATWGVWITDVVRAGKGSTAPFVPYCLRIWSSRFICHKVLFWWFCLVGWIRTGNYFTV